MTAHRWGECRYLRYHPPERVPFGCGIGYQKPVVQYECQKCGRKATGDGGSSMIMMQLDADDCLGTPELEANTRKTVQESVDALMAKWRNVVDGSRGGG